MIEPLEGCPKNKDGYYYVYDLYTFDNYFRLCLKNNFSHEQTLQYILAKCSLNAYVFQERIHNNKYKRITRDDNINIEKAKVRAQLYSELLKICNS